MENKEFIVLGVVMSSDVRSVGRKMNKVANGQTTEDGFSEECGLTASAIND